MTTAEPLTESERQALEQMREPQEQGSTLKDYATRIGLDVRRLYELRRRLVHKGAFGPLPRRKVRKSRKESPFLPVRVVPAAPANGPAITCRLVHPGGWVLECDGLPPATWIAAVLTGGTHVAP